MPSWPSNLPQTPLYSFSEQRQRNVAAFKPEVGPAKLRRRSTAVPTDANAVFVMTDAQVDEFTDFYVDDLEDGSLPFDWVHPVIGTEYTWVFDSEEAPTVERVAPDVNNVKCKLQRMPWLGTTA
jgi:hypothetical protein